MTLLWKFKHIWSGVEYGIFNEGLGTYTVLAWLPGGTDVGVEVARANVTDDGKGDYLTSVRVEKKHRRRGVATALYRAIELHIGRPLRPSPRYVSPDAEAFWAARRDPNRPSVIGRSGRIQPKPDDGLKIRRELDRVAQMVERAWKRHEQEPGHGDRPFICPMVGVVGRCTDSSVYLAERLGGAVYGYMIEDNPNAEVGAAEGGHDFVVVNDRWLVDFWAKDTYQPQDLHDMADPAQMENVRRLYGDPSRWVRMSPENFERYLRQIT